MGWGPNSYPFKFSGSRFPNFPVKRGFDYTPSLGKRGLIAIGLIELTLETHIDLRFR